MKYIKTNICKIRKKVFIMSNANLPCEVWCFKFEELTTAKFFHTLVDILFSNKMLYGFGNCLQIKLSDCFYVSFSKKKIRR